MEPKSKRKRPNFFDVLIILLILLAAVVAYWLSHSDSVGQTSILRTYQIELTTLRESMVDYVSVGDSVTDTVKNYAMGTVVDIQVLPEYNTVVDKTTGVARQAEVPGYVTLLLTVESETSETEEEITTVGGYTIRTGISVSCSVGTLVASGYILEVERLED